MVLFKREYAANVIDEDGKPVGSVYVRGRLNLWQAWDKLIAQKGSDSLFLVDVRRLT
jgi:hypothetical protein